MITVTYSAKRREMRMKGHADYSEPGNDIVCASASMLFYTLCQSLVSIEENLAAEPKMEMTKGRAAVKCIPKTEHEGTIDVIFWTILNGFHMLAQQYPENVYLRILDKEKNNNKGL